MGDVTPTPAAPAPTVEPTPAPTPAATAARTSVAPAAPAPRKRKRRWLIRIPIILIIFVLVLIALVQALLWSDYPRQIAESQISRVLNVHATVRGLKIEWDGHTQVEGLTITLPLSDEPILQVERVDIHHTPLSKLAFAQQVERVAVEGVKVDLREQADGHWNFEQLIASRPKSDTPSSRTGSDLPSLVARDVSVRVTRYDGRHAELAGIQLDAIKSGALAYAFDARVADDASAKGSVALAGDLRHEVTLQLSRVPDVAGLFVSNLPSPLTASVNWSGRLTADGGLDGKLRKVDVTVAQLGAKGDADIELTGQQRLIIRPRGFQLSRSGDEPMELFVDNGTITADLPADRAYVRIADALHGKVLGGSFAVTGNFNPRDWGTDLWVDWKELKRKELGTSGYAEVHASRNFAGVVSGTATVTGVAELPDGRVVGAIALNGSGESLASMSATFTTQPCTFEKKDKPPIALPAIVGELRGAGSLIHLTSLRPVDASVAAVQTNAGFDRSNQHWWASIETRGLKLPVLQKFGVADPIDVSFNANGDRVTAQVERVFVKVGNVAFHGNGTYKSELPKPLNLLTHIWYQHATEVDDQAQISALEARGELNGTLWPVRQFDAKGDLYAKNLVVAGHAVGDVAIKIDNATLNEWAAHLESKQIEIFGADCTLNADWTAFSNKPLTVVATWTDLPMSRIGDLAGVKDVTGKIDSGVATIVIPSTHLREIGMTAWLRGAKLAHGPLVIDALTAKAWMKDGIFSVQPILTTGEGQIDALASIDITKRDVANLSAWLTNWPAPKYFEKGPAADLSAVTSGDVRAAFAIRDRKLTGDVKLSGRIDRTQGQVGAFKLQAASDNTTITLDTFELQTLDGTATATGKADLNDLNNAKLDAKFDRLAPSELAWIKPVLKDIEGRYSGVLSVHPVTGERALGPSEIKFSLQPKDGRFRKVDIGDTELTAYATYESNQTFRLVSDKAIVHVAGGEIKPFARITNLEGRGLTQLVTANFTNLDLMQLVKSVDDDGRDIVGRVSGEVRVFGTARSVGTLAAEVDAKLEKSDLANFGPLAFMYNLAHVFSGGVEPNGAGNVSLRLEQGTVTVTNASYFNRGLDVRAYGKVSKLDDLDNAEMDLTLLGSTRPFKDIKLPFFEDLDKTLSVVQQSAITVVAQGPLKEPKPRQALLSELGASVRGVLLGNVKKEQQGK
jgi:hypothetical protein